MLTTKEAIRKMTFAQIKEEVLNEHHIYFLTQSLTPRFYFSFIKIAMSGRSDLEMYFTHLIRWGLVETFAWRGERDSEASYHLTRMGAALAHSIVKDQQAQAEAA